jgi:DNA-binding response OmpR family regulator
MDAKCAGTAAPNDLSSPRAPEAPPAVCILVIDDDLRIRQMIQWALQEEGLKVETAGDGQQGIERAMAIDPALVVLDLGLPLLDGAAVADKLRAASRQPPAILLITASDRPQEWARRLGAYAYLRKPFDVDDLVAAVFRGLNR